jgi:hypothetical protein
MVQDAASNSGTSWDASSAQASRRRTLRGII